MATRLKNILRFTGLVVGTPVSIPHNLNLDGVDVVPDKNTPQSGSFTVVADATNVTVTRNVGDVDNVDVLAEYWHTEDRVFGSDGTPFSQLAPAPFVASPGPGAGQAQNPILKDGSTVNIYVDSINGLDTNDGLTITTPIQTFTELYTKFPIRAIQNSRIIVHLAGVSGFGASATAVADYDTVNLLVGGDGAPWGNSYVYRGPQMVPVTPTTGPATAALDVVPVVAILGGAPAAGGTRASRFDFTTAAPAWTINDFRGKFLRITRAGILVIVEAPIYSNTADTISVFKDGLAALGSPILASDTVEIVEPGARFINDTDPATSFDNVRVTGTGISDWDQTDLDPAPATGLTFTRCSWRSAPVLYGAFGIEFDRCRFNTYLQAYSSSLSFVSCSLEDVLLRNCTWGGGSPLPLRDSATSPIPANYSSYMDLQAHYLEIGQGGLDGPSHWYNWRGIAITGGSGYYGVWVGPNSTLGIGSTLESVLQGILPAGSIHGLSVAEDGHVVVVGNTGQPGATSLFGAGGDVSIDDGTPTGIVVSYGVGAGDLEEVAGYNGYFQSYPTAPGDKTSSARIRAA